MMNFRKEAISGRNSSKTRGGRASKRSSGSPKQIKQEPIDKM